MINDFVICVAYVKPRELMYFILNHTFSAEDKLKLDSVNVSVKWNV